MADRQDIPTVRASRSADDPLVLKLAHVEAALEFAHRRLDLPDNGSYRSVAWLDRDAVLWNVFAAPEFDLQPHRWCYPLVGCVPYRGWFSRRAADREARQLAGEGLEVRVRPVPAYSTLGRMRDPLTGPMLRMPVPELIATLFHELAHQKLYVADDGSFSESYATAVARAGLVCYLSEHGRDDWLAQWQARRATERQIIGLMLATRERLDTLYRRPQPEAGRRVAKYLELEQLRMRLHDEFGLDAPPGGFNNADLAQIAVYERKVGAFLDLLAEYGGDFAAFHGAVRRIANSGAESRKRFLDRPSTTGPALQTCIR